jgi:hypothetical protein
MQDVHDMSTDKYAFVAYVGSDTAVNPSRWFRVAVNKWELLRHQLESFGAHALESETYGLSATSYNGQPPHSTMLMAYVVYPGGRVFKPGATVAPEVTRLHTRALLTLKAPYGPALKASDYVMCNAYILLVRTTVPEGAKAYVPVRERLSYALLQEALVINPDDEDAKERKIRIDDMNRERFHAADRPILQFTRHHDAFKVTERATYSEPPIEYQCATCQRFGHHYREACYLWPLPEDKTMSFGAKRLGPKTQTAEKDATFYAMVHKKRSGKH